MAAGDTEIVFLSQDHVLAPSLGSVTHWPKRKHPHKRAGLWVVLVVSFSGQSMSISEQIKRRGRFLPQLSPCNHLKNPSLTTFSSAKGLRGWCVCVSVSPMATNTAVYVGVHRSKRSRPVLLPGASLQPHDASTRPPNLRHPPSSFPHTLPRAAVTTPDVPTHPPTAGEPVLLSWASGFSSPRSTPLDPLDPPPKTLKTATCLFKTAAQTNEDEVV